MRILFAALALSVCAEAAAQQQMYKCKNAAGRITYSGSECKDLGLTSAGEIKGEASVMPSQVAPSSSAAPAPAPARRPRREEARSQAPEEPPPAAPERRCFTVKTAKGNTTRCNDTPPGD